MHREKISIAGLPEGVELWVYGDDDLIMAGPNLTDEAAKAAIASLPEAVQERVIGWRRLAS